MHLRVHFRALFTTLKVAVDAELVVTMALNEVEETGSFLLGRRRAWLVVRMQELQGVCELSI